MRKSTKSKGYSARARKLGVSRQRIWQIENKKLGRCAICPMRRVNKEHCEKHRHDANETQKRLARVRRTVTLTPVQKEFLQILHNIDYARVGPYGDGLPGNSKTVDKLRRMGLVESAPYGGPDNVRLTKKGTKTARGKSK